MMLIGRPGLGKTPPLGFIYRPIREHDDWMYEKYNEMLTGKTALFISHRLASTRFCDHILFLENGKITEEGTHEELMQENGGYAEMFLVQSRYYKEEGAQSHEEHMAGI